MPEFASAEKATDQALAKEFDGFTIVRKELFDRDDPVHNAAIWAVRWQVALEGTVRGEYRGMSTRGYKAEVAGVTLLDGAGLDADPLTAATVNFYNTASVEAQLGRYSSRQVAPPQRR